MALTKVLVTVKTYPNLSLKYTELVCTAGLREDGSWIRIHPVPYRMLDHEKQWYKKWQWIEADLVKNERDFRVESYRLADINTLKVLERIDSKKTNWELRRKYALKQGFYTNLGKLIDKAKAENISLAVFKPKRILDCICKPAEKGDWDSKKLSKIKANLMQQDLFEEMAIKRSFEIAKKIPYVFSYKFETEDGSEPCLMIEDWELGALYLNCLKRGDSVALSCEKVKAKYMQMARDNDLYLFLGTTYRHHKNGKNPFIIVGVFAPPYVPKPPKIVQGELFPESI